MTKLTALDLHPLYRNAIGVDRLFDRIISNIETPQTNYPPYNIVQVDDDTYVIEIAVAGFDEEEIEITQEQNTLIITGNQPELDDSETKFLHKGIAARNFRREFTLADHVEVTNASLEKGILVVGLKREIPEAMKPKRIAIGTISS
jgi:molecular chaperone IbpA